MSTALLHPEIQQFITQHFKGDVNKWVLKGSPFPTVNIQDLATQMTGKRKAQKKLPTWFSSSKVLYPPSLNLEQCSSEITGKYKANRVNGNRLIDLTGGFGVDVFFFAKNIKEVTHCELNQKLSALAQHNFNALLPEKKACFHSGDGIAFLEQSSSTYDWIYLDPARRSEAGGKVFRLEDCTPDILKHLPLLLDKGKNILVKTSPLLDLHLGCTQLKKVHEIHIVAVANEVKELLWVLSADKQSELPLIKCIDFKKNKTDYFESEFPTLSTPNCPLSSPKKYLYEPNAAVMKSRLFYRLSKAKKVAKLHPNSHLFTSEKIIDFPGRTFEIRQQLPYKPKRLKKELGLEKANISTRNFSKTPEQLKKELKLKDGGDTYLFFTTDLQQQKIVLICEKVASEN